MDGVFPGRQQHCLFTDSTLSRIPGTEYPAVILQMTERSCMVERHRVSLWATPAFILVLAIMACGPAFGGSRSVTDSPAAAETLMVSMSDAKTLFLKSNLALIGARYHLTANEADLVAARLFPNPQFSVNASFINLQSRPVDYSSTQLTYRIDQLIELWGKRGKRIDAAAHSVESARDDFQFTLKQLMSDFEESFLNLQYAQRGYDLASSSYDIFRRSVEIGDVRFRTGDIGEAELKKLRLAQLDYQQGLSGAEQDLADARARFRSLLNIPPGVPVKTLSGDLPAMALPVKDSLVAAALRNRTDLASRHEKTMMEESRVELAHAAAWPDLTLGVELDRQGPEFRNTFGGGIGISIPLFNRNQDDIQRAEAELQASTTEEQAAENEILNEVSAAFDKYKASWDVMQTLSSAAMRNAEEVRSMAVQNYNSGNIGLIDFLETERIYNDAVQSYYNALKKFAINQVELERATGMELFEENKQ